MKIRRVACIGAGYVGGPTMAVFADKCPDVDFCVVDIDPEKIAQWNTDDLPVFEPGLLEVVKRVRGRNLSFSTDIDEAIDSSEMILLAVNTPTKEYGVGRGMAADLKFVERCARQIGRAARTNKIVVEKSTLPVRTAEAIRTILDSCSNGVRFQVLSNPEFLAEGTAIRDLLEPDRVLIGGDESPEGAAAIEALAGLYERWVAPDRIIRTRVWSSELSKLTANAFLAQRVSSINAMSALCEATGADVDEIAKSVGMDSRVGPKFLKASVGFGGSCFQKDILNLIYLCRHYGLEEVARYWEQVIRLNDYQKRRFSKKVVQTLFNTVSDKKIAVFGWAFKKDTNDSRESAAIYIADDLLRDQAALQVYDPRVSPKRIVHDLVSVKRWDDWDRPALSEDEIRSRLTIHDDPYAAVKDAHAVLVLTEWDEFTGYDWKRIHDTMQKPAFLFDGRNILGRKAMEDIGFCVYQVGKGTPDDAASLEPWGR